MGKLIITRSVLGLVFLCVALPGHSQQADTTRYKIRYGLTGIYNRTNDDRSFVINNALAFSIVKKKISLNSSSSWIYGEQGGNLTNNDVNSSLNFDVLKDLQKLYYWGLANYTNSYSLKINYQFQGGAGLGYNIFNTDAIELGITDGVLFEASDLVIDAVNEKSETIRNSLRIKHRIRLGDVVSLEGSHFWQPSFSNANDYIIRSTTAISLKLKSWLSITGALTYNKISRTNRENMLVTFGFVAENAFTGRVHAAAPVIPVE